MSESADVKVEDKLKSYGFVNDGYSSLVSSMAGLGTGRDKLATTHYVEREITDRELLAAFKSNWIARRIVTLPPEDATRKWRTWKGDKADDIRKEEKRMGLSQKVYDAGFKGRLIGAGIFIGADLGSDLSEPINIDRIKKGGLEYLTVLTKREIEAGPIESDPASEFYSKPKFYKIPYGQGDADGSNVLQMKTRRQNGARVDRFSGRQNNGDLIIHPSRFAVFRGSEKIDHHLGTVGNNTYHKSERWFHSSGDHGWDASVLQHTYDAMRSAGATFDNVASLVFEANIDRLGIPDFSRNLANCKGKNGITEADVMNRVMLMAMTKGNNKMVVGDAAEEFTRNTINFGGLDRIIEKFFVLCGAPDGIPATVFLGQSPSGLNATGEADRAIWHEKVNSIQRNKLEPALTNVDMSLCMHVTGSVEGVEYDWRPLDEMSEAERSEIAERDSKTIQTLSETPTYPLESLYQKLLKMGEFEGTSITTFEEYRDAVAEAVDPPEEVI